jgi:signal recognition particle receptor subunit beta
MDWSWEEPFCGLKLNWYPGHMVKAQRALKERVKQVDMIVEVRDARVPLSSANPDLDLLLGEKPRLIVLNKKDLADARSTRMVLARLRQEVSGHSAATFCFPVWAVCLTSLLPARRPVGQGCHHNQLQDRIRN